MTTVEPPADDESVRTYANELLRDGREELNRADGKASFAFGSVSIAVSAVLAGFIGGGWRPTNLSDPWQALWWVGAMGAGAAICLLAAAVFPRTVHTIKPPTTVTYFGHVAELGSVDELLTALRRDARSPSNRVVDQLWHVSRIVRRKYRLIRWGFGVLGAACALVVAALLLDAITA